MYMESRNRVQFSSVTQSCPTLCDPMDCSTPGLPVHHHLREFTQTHIHRVSDAIQPSHPLSSPFPPAPIPPSFRVLMDLFLGQQWQNRHREQTYGHGVGVGGRGWVVWRGTWKLTLPYAK